MVKQAISTNGFNSDTASKYIVDAGAVYKNLTFTKGTTPDLDQWEGEPLGATFGGSSVSIQNEFRTIEVDGIRSNYVGEKILQRQTATMKVNLKEIDAETIRTAILGKITKGDGTTAPTSYDIIEGKGKVENSDYLTNLALVGNVSGTTKPIIIVLDNALCTSGLDFETSDNDEAVITLTFEAHASANQVKLNKLPARIYYPTSA